MLQRALIEAVHRLNGAHSEGLIDRFGLIGGFAVSTWGVPRATADIDFVLVTDDSKFQALTKSLNGIFRSGDEDDPLRGVIQFSVAIGQDSVQVQLVLFPHRFNQVLSTNIESIKLFDENVPIISWKMLVLMKVYAGGPQDLLDARQILMVRKPAILELEELRLLGKSLRLIEEVEDLLQN